MQRKLTIFSIHTFIWVLIIGVPILINTLFLETQRSGINVPPPFWFSVGLLMVIYYLNYYVFIPQFLFNKKYVVYALVLIGLFILMMKSIGIFIDVFGGGPPDRVDEREAQRMLAMLITNVFLMYVTVFFASIALRLANRWQQTEKERFNAQLSYLSSQINPHFLFNTLNSIYGMTIVAAPKAADMVSKLSEMMRYTLDSSRNNLVALNEELNYLRGYVELQKVRLDDNISLDVSIDDGDAGLSIAPLILLPFIENAFKYGVNAEQNSNIKIHIKTEGSTLTLVVFNNKVDVDEQHLKKSGFGIENTKNRLELIYPEKHELELIENDYDYTVKLQLRLD